MVPSSEPTPMSVPNVTLEATIGPFVANVHSWAPVLPLKAYSLPLVDPTKMLFEK